MMWERVGTMLELLGTMWECLGHLGTPGDDVWIREEIICVGTNGSDVGTCGYDVWAIRVREGTMWKLVMRFGND